MRMNNEMRVCSREEPYELEGTGSVKYASHQPKSNGDLTLLLTRDLHLAGSLPNATMTESTSRVREAISPCWSLSSSPSSSSPTVAWSFQTEGRYTSTRPSCRVHAASLQSSCKRVRGGVLLRAMCRNLRKWTSRRRGSLIWGHNRHGGQWQDCISILL